jgi:hypothetical protein
MFLSVDGWVLLDLQPRHLLGAPPSMFLSVDGGHSWISYSGTSQGGYRRDFLALMVSAPRSTALTPPRGPAINDS